MEAKNNRFEEVLCGHVSLLACGSRLMLEASGRCRCIRQRHIRRGQLVVDIEVSISSKSWSWF